MKKKSLEVIFQILNKIGSLSGRNAKEEVIRTALNIPTIGLMLRQVVSFAYDPFMRYNTTSVPFVKNSQIADLDKAFQYLESLAKQRGATDEAIHHLGELASVDEDTCALFNLIVTKDLRCGAGRNTWKKHITTLPTHDVMLCIDDMDKFLKDVGTYNNITTSIKLDGARNWAVTNYFSAIHLSRYGKEYPNCDKFDKSLMVAARHLVDKHGFTWPVKFDGEIAPKAEHGRAFDKVMTQLRRLKDVDPSVFEFAVFDVVDEQQRFTLKERYEILKEVFPVNVADACDVFLLEHIFDYGYESKEDILEHLEKVTDDGQEGLVLKKTNGYYETRRSNGWLKVKKFYTIDLAVVDHELGTGRNEGRIGALICLRNDVEVKVGSGYDDSEREEFLTDRPQVIEVKYQDVTKDGSLRFPVFVRVREDMNFDEVRNRKYTE